MNAKKLLFKCFLFCSFFITSTLYSQELQTVSRIGLGINGLDLSVEIPVANKISIEPSAGFGPSYSFSNSGPVAANMGWTWALLEPSIHAGIYGKYFYSRDRQILKGKSVRNNTGHFIGVKTKYVSKPLTNVIHGKQNVLLTNLNWGGQHNIGTRWNYSYSVGVGYGHNLDFSAGTFYPAFDVKISYILPSRK